MQLNNVLSYDKCFAEWIQVNIRPESGIKIRGAGMLQNTWFEVIQRRLGYEKCLQDNKSPEIGKGSVEGHITDL